MIERNPMQNPIPGDRFLHHKGHYAFVATMLGERKGYPVVYGYTVRLVDGTRGNKTCRSYTTLQDSFAFERHDPQP